MAYHNNPDHRGDGSYKPGMGLDGGGDNISRPGPVLRRATKGKFRKGKKPKEIPSASAVADKLAASWGP